MRAVGADGEELVARTREHHVVVTDLPDHHPAVCQRANIDAFGEIRHAK